MDFKIYSHRKFYPIIVYLVILVFLFIALKVIDTVINFEGHGGSFVILGLVVIFYLFIFLFSIPLLFVILKNKLNIENDRIIIDRGSKQEIILKNNIKGIKVFRLKRKGAGRWLIFFPHEKLYIDWFNKNKNYVFKVEIQDGRDIVFESDSVEQQKIQMEFLRLNYQLLRPEDTYSLIFIK